MTVTDYPDYQTSQDHANKISTTGVPLLHFKNVLGSQTSFTNILTGNVATLLNAAGFAQTSYEISIALQTGAAALTASQVILNWIDSTTGFNMGTERYWLYAGQTGFAHKVRGIGPTMADTLTLTIDNHSGNTVQYQFVALQRSLPLTRPLWVTNDALSSSIAGAAALAHSDVSAGWLASESIAGITAGSHQDINLPLYTGTVLVRGQTTATAAGKGEIRIINSADVFGGALELDFIRILSGQSDSTQPNEMAMKAVPMPRSHTILRLINNDTVAQTLTASIVAYDMQ